MAKTDHLDLGDREARTRLRHLMERLQYDFGPAIDVQDDDGDWWLAWFWPARPDALSFGWIYWSNADAGDVIFQLDVGGVRWELSRTSEDLEFMEQVIQALIDGTVYSIRAPHRAQSGGHLA